MAKDRDESDGGPTLHFLDTEKYPVSIDKRAILYVQTSHRTYNVESEGKRETMNYIALGTLAGVIHVRGDHGAILDALDWAPLPSKAK